MPASLDMRDYVYIEGDGVLEAPTAHLDGLPSTVPGFYRPGRAGPSFRPERVLGRSHHARATRSYGSAPADRRRSSCTWPWPHRTHPCCRLHASAGALGSGRYADFVAETDARDRRACCSRSADSGAAANTLVMFTSDNGPAPIANIIDRPAGKGPRLGRRLARRQQDLYEGGHRVPFIVRWPGVVAPGSTSAATIGLVDLMATAADVVGERLPADAAEDSVSFLPVLRRPEAPFDRGAAIVMQSGDGSLAIRDGRWKLCLAPGSGGLSSPRPGSGGRAGPSRRCSSTISSRIPARRRIWRAAHPDVVRRLTALLETVSWRRPQPALSARDDATHLLEAVAGEREAAKRQASRQPQICGTCENSGYGVTHTVDGGVGGHTGRASGAPSAAAPFGQGESREAGHRSHIRIRDPFVLPDRDEQVYYIYGSTNRGLSPSDTRKEVVVYRTRDLEDWGEPITAWAVPADHWARETVWAPEVHRHKGRYYLLSRSRPPSRCRRRTGARRT